ncbi:MAG: ATP-binding protein [Trichodesmium sp. MO_231.B1]|nr:ATP-binding protein [Trichodesmium sp. MO_231.B1]
MLPNNPNEFTQKAWEAISRTSEIAKTSQSQQIETEHLMKALLEQNGLATSLFNKAGVSTAKLQEYTDTFINRKVKNTPNNIYLGQSLSIFTLLCNAEKYRQEYRHEYNISIKHLILAYYISIEHLILAYLEDDRFGKNLYQEFKLDEAKLKETISQVGGNPKVTDKNPEGKYEALEKYRHDELAKYLEQLLEARLEVEAAENFSYLLSPHVWRKPLEAVIGYSDLLDEEASDLGYDNLLPNLKRITLEALHILEMWANILEIFRIEAGNFYLEGIEVNNLIQDVVDIAKNPIEKNCNSFKLVLGENLGIMYADMRLLKCVLIKILDNAAKFTENGLITLSVERVNNQKLQSPQNQNAESLNNAQNYIVFRVSDTGIGLTEEQLKDIFEPLTTHCSYSGLGLGLAIYQGWCERMGAKIEVESEYGEGSTFTVWFPERMNQTLPLDVDEAKLQETISQVKKLIDKNLEGKYEASEIYSREELATYIKQFQEAKIKAKAKTASILDRLKLINEFRTPLNAILREIEIILDEKAFEVGDDDFTTEVKSDLEQMKRNVIHLLKTVSDCSYIIQIETGKITLDLENIDVNQLIQDVVSTVKNITEKNGNTFKLILGENLGNMYAKISRVKDLLITLLVSSIEKTEDSIITLSVKKVNTQELQNDQNKFVQSLNSSQNYIFFEVSGIGIKNQNKVHVLNYNLLWRYRYLMFGDYQGLDKIMGAKVDIESTSEKDYKVTVCFPERVIT